MTAFREKNPHTDSFRKQLLEIVERELKIADTPGATIALLLNGKSVLVTAVGQKDLERHSPLQAEARFYAYSITKTMIATVILQLTQKGDLALDAPIQRYLPQLRLAEGITIERLLNHTSGLADYCHLPEYINAIHTDPTHPWDDEAYLAATVPGGLLFPPGEGWSYSNIGYLLLRKVIEAAVRTTFSTAMHRLLFAPLGLTETFIAGALADVTSLTPGFSAYLAPQAPLQDIRAHYHPGWVAHGVAVSTAQEIAMFLESLVLGEVLDPPCLGTMLKAVDVEVDDPCFRCPAYGLGVMIDRQSRHGMMVGHGGGGPGYSTGALHLPNASGQRVTAVALANRDAGNLGLRLAFELAMATGDALEL